MFKQALAAMIVSLALMTGAQAKSCQVIGDSIAVMIGNTRVLPCHVHAKGAMHSEWILENAVLERADVAIISTTSNDAQDWRGGHYNPKRHTLRNPAWSERNAEATRARSGCTTCIWVLPALSGPRALIEKIAARHGDPTISFKTRWDVRHKGDDIHPYSPKSVALEAKKIGGL